MYRWLCVALFASLTSPAVAAPDPDMTFQVVRSAAPGCEPKCAEWIAARGTIKPETARVFQAFLSQLDGRKRPLMIESGGGSVDASLAMGRMIRASGLSVGVAHTQTVGYPDAAGVARGVADMNRGICASACVFVLAAGVERFAGPSTRIGVHQIRLTMSRAFVRPEYLVRYSSFAGFRFEVSRHLIGVQKGVLTASIASPAAANARVAAHLEEMGYDTSLLALMQTASPDQIHWMTADEQAATHIVTSRQGRAPARRARSAPAEVAATPGIGQVQRLSLSAE